MKWIIASICRPSVCSSMLSDDEVGRSYEWAISGSLGSIARTHCSDAGL